MEEKKESLIKSFMSGLLGGLFSLTPMGNYGVLYTSGFLNNSLTKKPKIRWIWCALLAVLGLIIGTLPRLIMGVNYLEDKFPLATFLLFGIASLGLIIASLIKEVKKKDKTTLENILFPTLLIVGMAISFVMTFFLNKSSDQPLIENEYLSCLVFGFVMGFVVLIPGLPIHSISNIFGMSSTLETIMINIPDKVEITKSIGLIAIMIIGMLLNLIVFYYPYKKLFSIVKDYIGGLFIGLMLGSIIGSYFGHGEFIDSSIPPEYTQEVKSITLCGFIFAGILLCLILVFAFSNLKHKDDDINDNTSLYEQDGNKNKKKKSIFNRGRNL